MILTALRKSRGVQAHAANELKISERVLRYKMMKYRLLTRTKLSEYDRIVDDYFHHDKTEG
ncbi:MAG: helix-turn-helix domain-containing protein [Nitrospirae bacterium]|nr:helix-turn-helix domain-containing protein [Nitrospirota bacterium]